MSQNMMPEIRVVGKTLLWNFPFIAIFFMSTIWASVKTEKMVEEQDRVSILVEKNGYDVTSIVPTGKGRYVISFLSLAPRSKERGRFCWIISDLGLSKWCRV